MDTDFDFKPINEGLGFHRKVKPLGTEGEAGAAGESDDSFSFSTLGPGTLSQPTVEANSREQSKGLLSSGSNTTDAGSTGTNGKKKHNAKSVSDLIAALPPSLDFLLEEKAQPASSSSPAASSPLSSTTTSSAASLSTPPATSPAVSSAVSAAAASLRKSPLFSSPTTSGTPTPGAPAAASLASQEKTESKESKRGFLKMPLGRSDYEVKPESKQDRGAGATSVTTLAARAASSLDENVAKTFPTVFPHLGSLAGKPAAAAVKAATKSTGKATALETPVVKIEERALATHFGSAILDTLVAIGLGCVLLAVSLSITNANLLALLENTQTDRETISALALLFIAGGLLYVLAARSFLGATLGEWSYEIRVGEREARRRWFYPLQVVWRGFLVAATGFIVFPIISTIAGKDVLKYLTGLGLVTHEGSTAAE